MIHIYNAEKDLELQLANNKVVANCRLSPVVMNDKEKAELQQVVAAEYDYDLYPVSTILVSSGWNRNDDVFDAQDLVSAKCTPEHKPLNKQHQARDIVGHITRSQLVDDDLNVLAEGQTECNLMVEGVIYKHLCNSDADLQEETATFIQELDDGEWCVSMETLFSSFDYAIQHPALGNKILERNEETAFLTKHLRCYGGTGECEGFRVGRVLRNLTFSAQGFVKDPANPKSVVLKNKSFAAKAATMEDLGLKTNLVIGENTMSEDIQKKLEEANAEINGLRDKLAKADVESYTSKITECETAIEELTLNVANRDSKIGELETKVKETTDELNQSKADQSETDKELSELKEQLTVVAADKLRTDRISVLVDAGVELTEAESTVDKFIDISDEQFTDIVELKRPAVAETVEPTLEEDPEGEAVAEVAEVEEVVEDVVLATADDRGQNAVAALSEFLSSITFNKNK